MARPCSRLRIVGALWATGLSKDGKLAAKLAYVKG